MFRRRRLTCQQVVELVTEYLDGVMEPRRRARFEAHLAGCDGCTNYLEQFRDDRVASPRAGPGDGRLMSLPTGPRPLTEPPRLMAPPSGATSGPDPTATTRLIAFRPRTTPRWWKRSGGATRRRSPRSSSATTRRCCGWRWPTSRRGKQAEDAVQETWLGVLNGIDRFEGRSSLKTWIFRILVNRAKTKGVREQRSVPFSSLEGDGDEPEPSVDPTRFAPAGNWSAPPSSWDGDSRGPAPVGRDPGRRRRRHRRAARHAAGGHHAARRAGLHRAGSQRGPRPDRGQPARAAAPGPFEGAGPPGGLPALGGEAPASKAG